MHHLQPAIYTIFLQCFVQQLYFSIRMMVKNLVQPLKNHYLENTLPLRLNRREKMYWFEAAILVWLKVKD